MNQALTNQSLAAQSATVSPVRVCFIGKNNSGSWKIRGEQISTSRANWKATREPTNKDFQEYDVFCMVKHVVPEWVSKIRRLGKPLVYDVVDSWGQPVDGLKYTTLQAVRKYFADKWEDNGIDYCIFPNQQMKSDLGGLVKNSTFLYHHAWPNLKPVPPREVAKIIAYEGNETYLGHWREIIERVCAKHGLTFVINPSDWDAVDIAVAVRGGDHDSFMANRYKSNVKIANMFAAGIPALVGIKEISGHETDNGDLRFFSNEAEFESQLVRILGFEQRQEIHERFVAHGERFSLGSLADQFEQYFLQVRDHYKRENRGSNMGQPAMKLSQVKQLLRRVLGKARGCRAAERVENHDDPNLVRLNLGSGDKPLPGYLNVDIAPSRKGIAPDVVSDIRKLDLPDNYADEILAVHLIEHLYYWEVPDILREWMRVLKPGGKIVLECPNLLHAAKQILEDPEGRSGPGKEGQTTMWVFYGDPGWKDPLMCHRWGYTPASLQKVLREVGLVKVSQQPAQFKRREPRDMRIVGVKPAVV